MENTENIYNEAVLGMLSEISKKLDAIQANSKTKEIQSVNQEINPVVSKEEIESIVKKQATIVGKYVEYTHKLQVGQHNKLLTSINGVKKQIEALPAPEKVSLDPLMKLFPKPKKVTVCGFEFLRSSVIIFVLSLIIVFSLMLNIKQMDDYRGLKNRYSEQTEYNSANGNEWEATRRKEETTSIKIRGQNTADIHYLTCFLFSQLGIRVE
ncbi:hypothetical protein EZS27_011613 [termite gut metagenome]|uniref:Uncharacterized protein n=2 Tax=termite gut metagenome TaxID=433724 RepID=A0A5J4S2T4_9ZZZZ